MKEQPIENQDNLETESFSELTFEQIEKFRLEMAQKNRAQASVVTGDIVAEEKSDA